MEGSVTAAAEVYQPSTGTWTAVPAMPTAVASATGTRLPSGNLLIAGGRTSPTGQATNVSQLFNPLVGNWSVPGLMPVASYGATVMLVPNGLAIYAGGLTNTGSPTSISAAFSTSTSSWSSFPDMLGEAPALVSAFLPTPNGGGYWMVTTKGQVFNFGNARYFADEPGVQPGVRVAGFAVSY